MRYSRGDVRRCYLKGRTRGDGGESPSPAAGESVEDVVAASQLEQSSSLAGLATAMRQAGHSGAA